MVLNIGGRAALPTEHCEKRKYHRVPDKAAGAEEREVLQKPGDGGEKPQKGEEENGGKSREVEEDRSKPRVTPDTDAAATKKAEPAGRGIKKTRGRPMGKKRKKDDNIIVLPPILEFLVRDSTILGATGIAVSFLLYRHWSEINATRSLPFPVAAALMIFSFFLGHRRTVETDKLFAMEMEAAERSALEAAMERERAFEREEEEEEMEAAVEELERIVGKANASIVAELRQADATAAVAAEKEEGGKLDRRGLVRRPGLRRPRRRGAQASRRDLVAKDVAKQVSQARRHSVFVMALEKVTSKRIVFQEEEADIREQDLPDGFWTTLLEMPSREREDWEVHSGETGDKLMTRLLKDPGQYQRTTVGDKEVVDPLVKFRGIDVFHSDANESELSKRSILTKCGLRDKPMGMVHLLCPFGSIVSYFELPSWVDEAGGLEEKDSDSTDVKALKRFIKGDDEYRNKRLKIYPVLRKGPMAVRMLFYPPSKEFTIWGTMLPIAWYDQKPVTAADGEKKSLVVEACVDVVSNRLARSTAQVLGGSLKNMELDIAVVIGTPDGQKEKEPEACIGLWRYDHIDLQTGSQLPPKSGTESIMEASELRSTLQEISVAA